MNHRRSAAWAIALATALACDPIADALAPTSVPSGDTSTSDSRDTARDTDTAPSTAFLPSDESTESGVDSLPEAATDTDTETAATDTIGYIDCPVVVFAADTDMRIEPDTAEPWTSDGWTLTEGTQLIATYEFVGEDVILVEAYGSGAQAVWPTMRVTIDDTPIGEVTVATATPRLYVFFFDHTFGIHDVRISALIPATVPAPELHIASLTITCTVP